MNGEKKIIIAGVVILVLGISKAAIDKKPLDVPLVGGIGFILLLSLISAFSDSASNLAGDFAILGMVTVLLVDGPAVIQAGQTIQAGQPPTKTAGPSYTGISTAP